MKTRIIHTKIWQDDWFYDLSANAQRLFMYCLTNQHIGLSGIYELSDRVICFDLKLQLDELQQLKTELIKKVLFIEGWVCITNASKHCSYTGEKNEIAVKKELEAIPFSVKKYIIDTLSTTKNSVFEALDTSINQKSELINQKSETINQGMELLKKTLLDKGAYENTN